MSTRQEDNTGLQRKALGKLQASDKHQEENYDEDVIPTL